VTGMEMIARVIIYMAAALAIVLGVLGYSTMEQEHDHEEHSLLAGDAEKVVVVVAVMAVITASSVIYLRRKTPSDDTEEKDV